ncbi:MAG TPA: HdeA/HdeB family chaperone [Xanthobacteraceae bacterium]|nr:HdeA/HdeB family chaperone [Xanthobacteraceae bacterium]
MSTRALIVVTIGLALIAPAAAQETDLDKLTCDQFLGSNVATVKDIMLWLAGYYTYSDDATVINVAKIQDQERQIKTLCSENKAMSVLAASEVIMDKAYKK